MARRGRPGRSVPLLADRFVRKVADRADADRQPKSSRFWRAAAICLGDPLMRAENARLGVDTTTRKGLTARCGDESPGRARRSISANALEVVPINTSLAGADLISTMPWPINPAAAMSAAFMITASGMSSKTAPSTSIVRQGASPQTEQHLLLPTPAPIHSSIGLPAIQMRFDWAEMLLNELSPISRTSRIGSTFSGSSAPLNFATALCRCWCVASQRGTSSLRR